MKSILIHGLGQNASSWKKTVSGMNSEAECLDLLSLLNGSELSYENLYHAFSDYCDNISGNVDLCGLSLGAVLALNYAVENPQKMNSLVLIAGQYRTPKTLLKIQNMIFRVMPESAFYKIGLSKSDMLKLTQSMMKIDLTDSLKNIICPTLILCGEKDKANRNSAIEMNRCIRTSKLQFLQGAKHEVNEDAPEELAEILNEFYQQNFMKN